MQVSLSLEAAEPLKTELAAISPTYLNLSMPSWGTNTATLAAYLPIGPQPILGHVCLNLDSRAIQSNIAFTLRDQPPIHCSGRGVDTDTFGVTSATVAALAKEVGVPERTARHRLQMAESLSPILK